MSVPVLRFKEFSDNWEIDNLLSLSENGFTNGVFNDPTKVGSGYKLVNVLDMYIDTTIDESNLKLVELDKAEFLKNKVEHGDVFFTRSSLVKEGIAYSNTYLGKSDDITFDGHLIRMRPKKDLINSSFLNYLLKTSNPRSQLIKRGKTATMTTIGQADIAEVVIKFPSKLEQTKIANFLTAVDEKITQLTQKHDLLTQYKKGVMQQIFSQELRFKDDDGRDFPEWKDKTLDEVALSISNGLNLDQSIERTGYMVTRIETISDRKINLEKVGYVQTEQDISNYKLDVGDILFSNINSISHIGKVVFVDEDYQLYHGMNLLRIVINQITNNAKFVFYQLSSERMKQNFETKANKAVNQASINQTELKKTQLKIPSKPEQTKIANFLTAIDDKITAIQAQLDAVKQYKQGLLQQMFV